MTASTASIRVSSDSFVCELAADTPSAIDVASGSVLEVHCRSALDRDIGPGPVRAPQANPGTGPIAVTGCCPGQALRVDILDISPESPGHIAADWEGGIQAVEIRDHRVQYRGLEIPIAPMIGTLGVAPGAGSWQTMDAGPFGGNLDTNDIAPGGTVYLPVLQPGGQLILGDVHAVMGEGEIGGQGLEVAASVTLRVHIEARPLTDQVYLVRGDRLMTIGAAADLEDAVQEAADAMIGIIANAGVMSAFDARKLLGLAGDTIFGQHCCPTKTVRVAIPLAYLLTLREKLPIQGRIPPSAEHDCGASHT